MDEPPESPASKDRKTLPFHPMDAGLSCRNSRLGQLYDAERRGQGVVSRGTWCVASN
jgi:hypothetical protein